MFWGAGYTDIWRWWSVGLAIWVMFVVVWMDGGSLWWQLPGPL